MVKADAYGTGLDSAVRALESVDPWGYGVATVPEGLRIRALGVDRPILVLSPVPWDVIEDAISGTLTLCVSELSILAEIARRAGELSVTAEVHLEVDTGMGRSGFDWRQVESWAPGVMELDGRGLRVAGVFTHLHSADEAGTGTVEIQADRFETVLRKLRENGIGSDVQVHLCNSAGTLRRPDLSRSLVRPGIFLYGGKAGDDLPSPANVVSLRSEIVLLRNVPVGTTLGYGATYVASRPERWATLGIGYGDGLPRILGNRGRALIRGRRVPIIGRISMDLTVVDTTGVPTAEVGDTATLIGEDGEERITLDEVATLAGTISYEVLTGLTPRVPRVWLHEEHTGEGSSARFNGRNQGTTG
jgi:alanine racemase